jgi:flavin reductase (DIM6/NTAB) family NADH-FMN oxidoreductase RutF
MQRNVPLKVPYFGTPVVLISTLNEDGQPNLMPMSSAWWLGSSTVLGVANTAQTHANLLRERECVLNLVPADLVGAVDRIALLTATPTVPPHKADRGYRHERDKFGAAGLTPQPAELVRAPRIAESPIQIEAEVVAAHPLGNAPASAFETRTLRVHIEQSLLIPDTDYVDPAAWDPLIMKFCEFFGHGQNLQSSRLAGGWRMPHADRLPEPAGSR